MVPICIPFSPIPVIEISLAILTELIRENSSTECSEADEISKFESNEGFGRSTCGQKTLSGLSVPLLSRLLTFENILWLSIGYRRDSILTMARPQ